MEFARTARTGLGAVVVATTAAVVLLMAAAPAVAEKADLSASCGAGGAVLAVDLKGYAAGKNTIKVQDGGIVLSNREFDRSYVGSFPRPADLAHTFVVTVRVAGNSRQSFVREVRTTPCAPPRQVPPPVSTVAPPSSTPTTATTTPTASSTPAPSATDPGSSTPPTTNTGIVPLGSSSELSDAGAAGAIPLLIGLCLVSALGMVLFSVRRRHRSD
ncbi:hypothetical protein ACFFQW_40365 [Umezawaea endophytica]|uniref:LPXTG-motif cell wall-anchored protein n=1 Tax=Umezawaea endophytica TaxID=1654476 RepID=A0A9X2VXR7_9PSEU|nr:hypothetical protein [Umezawaea endophytica]MCS7484147.1 hypothetical protein [Umezawaea endophytica]